MKRIILYFIVLWSINSLGQEKLKIEIDNPEPRVGQKITFFISDNFFTDYFKTELGEDVDFTRSTSIFRMQSDKFERIIIFKKAKKYTIGPFKFDFNGNKYSTNTIELNVLPELPMEIGVWLRIAEFEGQKYLILEQLIGNESNKTENKNNVSSHTIGGIKPEGEEFAELNEELTEGVKLKNYSTSSNTLNAKGAGLFDVGFTYSIKKYKIIFDENFDGNYIISEKDFKNLPDEFDIEKIEVKK